MGTRVTPARLSTLDTDLCPMPEARQRGHGAARLEHDAGTGGGSLWPWRAGKV